eukprot:PLAT11809.1.p1 GENE.PLAT11809.1~~PLAT11809.1.p1  ORF type:complete len:808 (-),score=317.94 PLAT11809.1:209-2551(-)
MAVYKYTFTPPPLATVESVSIYIIVAGVIALLFAWFQAMQVQKVRVVAHADGRDATPRDALMADDGADSSTTKKLKEIHSAIEEGATSFLMAEYRVMAVFIVVFGVIVLLAVGGSSADCGKITGTSVPGFTNVVTCARTKGACWLEGAFTAISFAVGGTTSIVSGYIGMKIAVYANVRTAISAQVGWKPAFNTAFRAGAVMGFALVGLALLLLYALIGLFSTTFPYTGSNYCMAETLFEAIAGYGLGGSSIALFGRVGGGIYTKAADVGADLVGKVEAGIPEDDPRNPAVIADNVGDNVGDVAGMGADLFGSFAESTCAALVVASVSFDLNRNWPSLVFPLTITATGIFCCLLTSFIATDIKPVAAESDVEQALKIQLIVSTVLMTPAFYAICAAFLPAHFCIKVQCQVGACDTPCLLVATPGQAFICIAAGLWAGLIIGYITEYYTSHSYTPVREVARSCKTGHATNIIYGLALGYKSVIIPVFALALTIFLAFHFCDMYGVALAALGMLSNLPTGLTIDAYGPISDNAGGIAEMAELGEHVRDKTDALDAAGNTTAAIGKGFAIGSAALVSLALFGAFVTRVDKTEVNILQPITFATLLIGAMLPYWFSAMTMKSVGEAAGAMVEEVRKQFAEIAGIMDYTGKPNYARCVQISTDASLREMLYPGALVMLTPLIVGFFFGVNGVTGILAGGLTSGVQMAISSSNAGGAWDNAKKYVEKGNHGGKGSEAHKAAITGDTVGDPLKDTSGPSLNILMKLMAIISLVFAPFFRPGVSLNWGS